MPRQLLSANFSSDGKYLTLTLPVYNPSKDSKSGKSELIASTEGFVPVGLRHKDAEIMCGINVFIKKQ